MRNVYFEEREEMRDERSLGDFIELTLEGFDNGVYNEEYSKQFDEKQTIYYNETLLRNR